MIKLAVWTVVCLAVLLYLATRKFYLGGDWGFVDSREDESKRHGVDREKLVTVVERFLVGDSFDELWVAHVDDEDSGLDLNLRSDSLMGSLSLYTTRDAERVADTVSYLSEKGYAVEESRDRSIGPTEDQRLTTLEFSIPNSTAAAIQAIDSVLDRLQPNGEDMYFVHGSRTSDRGKGLKIGKVTDPLAEIVG